MTKIKDLKEKEEAVTFRLPKTISLELKAISETGYYRNVSEFLKDSINLLLYSRRDLRTALACYLYKDGAVSLGKASEILGENIEETKNLFVKKGIKLRRGAESEKEIKEEITHLKKFK